MKYHLVWKVVHVMLRWCHPVLFSLAMAGAFLLRFEFDIPNDEASFLVSGLLLVVPLKLAVFACFQVNHGWWRYTGLHDLIRLLAANATASLLFTALAMALIGRSFPRSIYCLDFLLCFLLTGGVRFLVRVYSEMRPLPRTRRRRKHILIYGAGAAGIALVRELRTNPKLGYHPAGFLDDDEEKIGAVLGGLRVLGSGRDAAAMLDTLRKRKIDIEEIVIAMPSADGRQMREAIANCRAAKIGCKTIPGVGELLREEFLSTQIRNVEVTDLLGREPVDIAEEYRIRESISGRSVMVTGAAGSIGSELCRQVAGFEPERLIVFDQAESELFRIDLKLRAKFPGVQVIPVLGDVRDPRTLSEVIRKHHTDSIFHAAAYKHVPMMEAFPIEGVRNNILGTWNLAQAAYQSGVSTFAMISSDKAVNPASVMGACKRASELLLSGMPQDRTRFVSVRFGNVLGSNGSVIPTFQSQIEAGGPVTVTHPEMSRFFMTIREAVQLVLLASTIGGRSEVLMLDMGEPVKIAELARQMIRLAGLAPNRDIEIRYVGLRPGEKLREELAMASESVVPTSHPKIRILKGPQVDGEMNKAWLVELKMLLERRTAPEIVDHLRILVPEYRPAVPAAEAARSPAGPLLAASAG